MSYRITKIFFFILVFCNAYSFAQDSIVKYRTTTIQASLSHFILVDPKYPQVASFFPAGIASIKSFRVDSSYNAEKKYHFMITFGAARSRFELTDPEFFKNKLDKSPFYVFSKRFFGGFGLNKRFPISKKLILDVDLAPCYVIIWDKSEDTRADTAYQESKGYEDIYQGLHLFAGIKLEKITKGDFGFFFSLSGTVPLINKITGNNEDYGDTFKGQIFAGIGLTYFYKSKRKVEMQKSKIGG